MARNETLVSLEHGLAMLALRMDCGGEIRITENSSNHQDGVSIPKALSIVYSNQIKPVPYQH